MPQDTRHEDDRLEAARALSIELDAVRQVEAALISAQRRVQALGQAVDALAEAALSAPDIAAALDASPADPGAFGYIAYGIDFFLDGLAELDGLLRDDLDYVSADLRYRPVRFVEVGCGPARNLFLVRQSQMLLWAEATGFDIVAPYITAGQRAFGLGAAISVADANTFDYGHADVIFAYRPFTDTAKLARFEAHMVGSAPVGAYIWAPLSDTMATHRCLLPKGESGSIWKKISETPVI